MPARKPAPRLDDPYEDLAAVALALDPADLEAWLTALEPADAGLVEQVLADRAALGWRTDPAAMAAHLDPAFRRKAYVRYLSAKFVQLTTGESPRQIWNLPARYGKSLLGSQWGPVWVFDRRPDAKIILTSYGDELANENAMAVRDRLRAHADELRCQLRWDRQRQDRFVTDAGGGLLAAGINSAITGFGAGSGGGVVIDDPFKNWAEAHSEAQRRKVWQQFRGTLRNRLDDEDAWILVVHHRVHEDDLTGKLTEAAEDETGEAWDTTVLPALAVEGDVLGRAPGEPLDPERFPVEACRQRARAMGSYLASALEQQAPAPEEGNELLRAWFRLEETLPLVPDEALTSWDLKLKDREAGDYVVGQLWWRTGTDYWLIDQLRGGWDHGTTANAIALMAVRHPEVRRHVVEAAGSADEVLPALRAPQPGYEVSDHVAGLLGMNEGEREAVALVRRRGMAGLVPEPVKGSKDVRARAHIAPAAEAGHVHLPAHADWVPHLLDELAAFPNGAHDDQVDAMSQALRRLSRGPATARAARGQVRQAPPGSAPPVPRGTRPGGARVVPAIGRLRRPGSR